jgi:hypothetical protein
MFSMGDLNFRTKLPLVEAGSPEHIQACHELAAEKDWFTLNQHDELSKALREKECLVGFRTPYCNFDPTFKVSRQNGYEYNVKRSPSYTDRILFKTGDQLEPALKTILYEPVATFTTSDHKPIRGVFDIRLNEKLRLTEKLPSLDKKYSLGLPEVSPPSTLQTPGENLHIFVSSIQCNIDQTEYNKGRKTNDSKADPPSPYVSFVSTPSEAIRTDASKRGNMWNKLGFRTKSSSLNSDGNSTKKKTTKFMTGWPGTTPLPSTFKANWNNEEVHFVVRTHHEDGVPIELSGALLHISLFDNKGGEPKLLGSFSLNLARLIEISTEPQEHVTDALLDDSTNEIPFNSGWSYSQRTGPSAALWGGWKEDIPTPVRTVAKSLNQANEPLSPTMPGRGHLEKRGQPKTSLLSTAPGRGHLGKRGPPQKPLSSTVPDQLGKQTPPKIPLPSTVPERSQPGKQGPPKEPLKYTGSNQSQLRRRESRTILTSGPSHSMRNAMGEAGSMKEKLKELKFFSLELDEPLTESGMEVGRVMCSIDVCWMEDNEPAKHIHYPG